jgi:hypothetical protein
MDALGRFFSNFSILLVHRKEPENGGDPSICPKSDRYGGIEVVEADVLVVLTQDGLEIPSAAQHCATVER